MIFFFHINSEKKIHKCKIYNKTMKVKVKVKVKVIFITKIRIISKTQVYFFYQFNKFYTYSKKNN